MSSVGVKNQIITDTGYVRTLLISKKTNKIANVWRVIETRRLNIERGLGNKHKPGTWQLPQSLINTPVNSSGYIVVFS